MRVGRACLCGHKGMVRMAGFLLKSLVAVVSGSLVMVPVVTEAGPSAAVSAGTVAVHCSADWNKAAVVGSPRRDVNGVADAGAVVVRIPGWAEDPGTVLTSEDLGVPAEQGAGFGAAVAWGAALVRGSDRGGQRTEEACPDLVIGVPGANGGRGAVVVVPDLGAGLDLTKAIWLDTSDLGLQPGDALGSALTVVDGSLLPVFPAGTRRGRLMLGHCWSGRSRAWRSRRVSWRRRRTAGSCRELMESRATPIGRTGSVPRCCRDRRHRRFSVPAVVVGIPNEDVGRRKNVGAVATLLLQNGQLVQNTLVWLGHGLPGKPRAGDRLGAAVVGPRAIGIPGRDANGRKDSGAVLVLDTWSASGAERTWRMFTQNMCRRSGQVRAWRQLWDGSGIPC